MNPLQLIAGTLVLSILFYSCDKNEYPPNISDQVFSLEENAPAGTIVGTVLANDSDEDQKISFDIIEGNFDGTFNIDPASGSLSVVKSENIDFEQTEQFLLSISVNDNHEKDPLESTVEVQIDIVNINEIPQDGIQTYYNCSNNTNDVSGNNYHFSDPGLEYGTDRKNNAEETFSLTGSLGLSLLSQEFNNQSEPQSISLWFKTASSNSVDYGGLMFGLLGRGEAGSGSRFMISMKEGAIRAGYGDEWGDDNKWGENLESDIPLNDNKWHHVVFISNGDEQMAYLLIDNEVVESRELIKSNHNRVSNIDFKIGGDKVENYFNGELDELIFYQRALSLEEVEAIYVEK